jgi:hypothetical protein
VTAPAKHQLEANTGKPSDSPHNTAMTSDIAVMRLVDLLSEIVAKGAFPAL